MTVVWSEWRDLNPRPSGPKPDALPNYATLRDIGKYKILEFLLIKYFYICIW